MRVCMRACVCVSVCLCACTRDAVESSFSSPFHSQGRSTAPHPGRRRESCRVSPVSWRPRRLLAQDTFASSTPEAVGQDEENDSRRTRVLVLRFLCCGCDTVRGSPTSLGSDGTPVSRRAADRHFSRLLPGAGPMRTAPGPSLHSRPCPALGSRPRGSRHGPLWRAGMVV